MLSEYEALALPKAESKSSAVKGMPEENTS